jgi:putative acetyltransferase
VRRVELRAEAVGDREAVRDVVVRAFGGGHGAVVAALMDDLRGSIPVDGGLSLVAEDEGAVVGQVMFTRSWLDAPRRLVDVLVLSPLAVRPDYQKRGIGAALVRRGLEICAGSTEPLVFLEGDPGYYGRLGFVADGGLGFRKPSLRIPDAAFQVVTLPAYAPWMTGTLVYSELFWRYDSVGLREPDPETVEKRR